MATQRSCAGDRAGRTARLLRGRRSRHRHRGAGARGVPAARVRAPGDRAQPPRRRGAARQGRQFVDELDEVPDDATVIFSAHGVSPAVRDAAQRRGLRVIDATCPLVTKVHLEAIRYAREGYSIMLVGHAGPRRGRWARWARRPSACFLIDQRRGRRPPRRSPDPDKVAYLTQTTLSVDDTRDCIDALRRRFPKIVGPAKDDICYATQNRQAAVKTVARARCDLLLVIGAANSSNATAWSRCRAHGGTPSLPDRRPQRHRAGVARRARARGRHRGRVHAGASRDRGGRGAAEPARR